MSRTPVQSEERLTEDCGPHCGIKDNYVGHCEKCHTGLHDDIKEAK